MDTEFTQNEIDLVLKRIEECMNEKRYHVAINENRIVNINFIDHYLINKQKRKQILMELDVQLISDFIENTKIFFSDNVVYIFAPQNTLFNLEDNEYSSKLIAKYNLFDYFDGKRMCIINFEVMEKKYNCEIRT